MNDRLERFVALMKGIFELDKSDLDFGIYRIMNIRKTQIEEFLEHGLPKKVQETLSPFADDLSAVNQRMREIEKQCTDLGIEISASPKLAAEYEALKQKKAAGADMSALETDVYSALYSFFSRYYDEGDFISKRRYKEGVYAIPYEGEEVKLYWANQDQYYIKTSENFKDYIFVDGDLTVHFRLVDATQEQNNNKESEDSKRVFMLYTETEESPDLHTFEWDAERRELIIRFVFDIPEDKKKKYAEENYARITEWLAKTHPELVASLLRVVSSDSKKQVTLLQKHLTAYVAKNTFDYFIHKDLGGFLRRELDFYIKSEIMRLDDLDTDDEQRVETWLAKVKAIKKVGHIIIDFLAQIEDFQKKLWLKKKFVVETNWCITLDNIPEEFWPEIAGNKAQTQEWITMYAIDEAEGWSNPPSLDFLRANANLVVDTRHFTSVFRNKLIASVDGLDIKTNGIMVWGNNVDYLSLANSQRKDICVCIDPPYNTGDDGFLYKDCYKSSSWLTMISDALIQGMSKVSEDGVMFVFTSDEEQEYIASLVRQLFGKDHFFATLVWEKKKKGSFLSGSIASMKDYVLCISKSTSTFNGLIGEIAEDEETYPCVNATNPRDIRHVESGITSKYREKDYTVKAGTVISSGNMNIVPLQDIVIHNGVVTQPFDIEGNWRYSQESFNEFMSEGTLYLTQDLYLRRIVRTPRYKRMKDLLLRIGDKDDASFREYNINNLNQFGWGTNEDANDELMSILGEQYMASYPKPSKLITLLLASLRKDGGDICDYFAGSATTGHAVLNLNRADGGHRKYILVEMGNYFNTVTKPRMMKVIYSSDWKDGKPTSRTTGVSQIMKYIRLESYEDALSNVELDTAQGDILSGLFGDEYLVHYLFRTGAEKSLLNIDAFRDPFAYRMKITENNEAKLRPVDLVETFNYLIGLSVARVSTVDWFRAVSDDQGEYEGAVRLQRDDGGDFAFQQIEGTLPDGRRALVIWRNVTDDIRRSNAALDAYFRHYRINPADREYNVIYVNGDNNLENIRQDEEQWKVVMTETEFKARMFEEE